MVDHELVTLLTDEELHVDAALGGRGNGVQQGLVGHEVGTGDRQSALCRVDQRREGPQVVPHGGARSARDDLPLDLARRWRGGADLLTQLDPGLAVPVGGEEEVERAHDRTCATTARSW